MSAIRIKIFATQFSILQSFHVSQDNKVPIEMELVDYSIPSNANVVAFVRGRYSSHTYREACTYSGNVIRLVPPTGFFVPGPNLLQVEINETIIPFYLEAICKDRVSTVGNPSTPDPVLPYVERAEQAAESAEERQEAASRSANEARESQTAAADSASAAADSASAAASSATTASGAETTATQKAAAAAESERQALSYKNNAEESASDAAASKEAAETAKADAEAAKAGAENAKNAAEAAQSAAETAKTGAEGAKTAAETARDTAITAKENAESAKTASETAKEAAETAKTEAVAAKNGAETAKTNAETAAENADTARGAAVTAKEAAELARDAAETAKNDAQSAQEAAESAEETASSAAEIAVQKAQEIADKANQIDINKIDIENLRQNAITLAKQTGLDAVIDSIYHNLVIRATSVEEVNALFAEWYHVNIQDVEEEDIDRNELIERWFGSVLYDDRVHGVKAPLFATSTSPTGELTDDSIGLSCTPSTASVAGVDDFAYLPQFWSLEVSMERNADGTHTINKIEFIDPISDVRSGRNGLCQALQKNTFFREWKDESYHYMQMCCDPTGRTEFPTEPTASRNWEQWPQGKDRNDHIYSYIANPKYYAGLIDNIPTSGTGLKTMNFTSHSGGVSAWRRRASHYSGASGNLLKWQLAMIWLKYAKKGNGGTIEGCSSYNYQYTAAASEEDVSRIILTVSQANNLNVGSTVIVGNKGGGTSIDRGVAAMRSLCDHKKIKSIEDVVIDEVSYKAVYIDNDDAVFNTVEGETYISTMPYHSGWNDNVKGYDGSRYNYTNGKETGLIQRTEFQNGSYLIVSDELWQWGKDEDGNYTFDCFTCHDQSKVTTGTITEDYEKRDDLTLTFPADIGNGWKYIEDMAISDDSGVIWPDKVSTAAGSGTGCKAGFYVGKAESCVRAAWCCLTLSYGGACGLAARNSYNSPGGGSWHGSVGCPSGISG